MNFGHICIDWESGVVCDCERIRELEAELADVENALHVADAKIKWFMAALRDHGCDLYGDRHDMVLPSSSSSSRVARTRKAVKP